MLKPGLFIIFVISLITVGFSLCRKTVTFDQGTITLDSNTSYQTITGWEAVAQVGQINEFNTVTGKSNVNPAFAKYRDQLFDQAVSDLGINRLRLEVRSGIENPVDYFTRYVTGQVTFRDYFQHANAAVNDNDDPQVINWNGFQFADLDFTIDNVILPMKQRLEARGEKLYVNLTYVDFSESAFEHRFVPEEYAEFVLAVFMHIQAKYGWVPDAWEMALEPDNASWSATQLGNALAAAGNRLKANGFNPDFIAPSTTSMATAISYFDQMVSIPGVTQFLSELSYHRYDGVSDANLQAIGSRAVNYNIKTAQLELIGATYNDLHKDLTLGRNSAWAQYVLAITIDDDDGSVYFLINESNPDSPTVSLGNRTKYLRQYFRYIRGGALRIKATSSSDNYDPIAFVNTDGKFVVVVKAEAGGTLLIQGLPFGTYGIKYTTGSQYNVDAADATISAGQGLNTTIPEPGVITIYAKTTLGPVSVDAAGYARAAAPGQIEAAFGIGFPPAVNISALAGSLPLPTKLGGISVRVNSVLAPLFFVGVGFQGAGAFQINYQVPYETKPGAAHIEILNNDVLVTDGYLIVSAAVPGIFTIAANGKGQAVALNQDLSLNGDSAQIPISKPESRGRAVIIFANGPGDGFVNPATGQTLTPVSGTAVPAGQLYATATTPTVTIGGLPATVAFSGLAPGLVGLWQLNAIIPATTPTGSAVPLAIKFKGQKSNSTTIAIN